VSELTPSFIIGGAARSGTTALAEALDRHPDVAMAKPLIPEPKVFATPAAGPAEYRARYGALFSATDAGRARGEKSTQYLGLEHVPAAVAATLPEVKMVFVLREPVARAYSNWAWSTRNGLESLPFEAAIETEDEREDPFPDRPWVRPHDYVSRCRYGEFARRWHAALSPERVAFFLFEELLERGTEPVQGFVGVVPRRLPLPAGLANETRGGVPPLDPAVAARLRERMRPWVEDFAALTGADVGRWGYR
jgi:hypothetical protein